MSADQAQQDHHPVPDRKRIEGQHASGLPDQRGLYDPANEHDACGVGFVARLGRRAAPSLVKDAVQILMNLEHRGAIGGDRATGDGAGLLLQIPDAFFREPASASSHAARAGPYAVGMVFLPARAALAERCMDLLERTAVAEGAEVLGWREVPCHGDHLGELARNAQPRIRQLFLSRGPIPAEAFERKLYVIRRASRRGRRAGACPASSSSTSPASPAARSSTRACCSAAACGVLPGPERPAFASCPRAGPPALQHEHVPDAGAWPSRSACWPTTARSTPCAAT